MCYHTVKLIVCIVKKGITIVVLNVADGLMGMRTVTYNKENWGAIGVY